MTAQALTAAIPGRRLLAPTAAPVTPYTRERRVLGDPTPLACTVAKAALEVALGLNGLDRLNRWVTSEIRAQVSRQQSLSRRAGYTLAGVVGVARVRVYRVSATAAEVSVVATEGERVRPIALRLEDTSGRWLITSLELG